MAVQSHPLAKRGAVGGKMTPPVESSTPTDDPRYTTAPRSQFGIRTRVALLFSAVIVLLILLFGSLTIDRFQRAGERELAETEAVMRESLIRKGVATVKNAALSAENALAGSNFLFLQNMIETTVSSDEDVSYGAIVDAERKSLVLRSKLAQAPPVDARVLAVTEASHLLVRSPSGEEVHEVAAPIGHGKDRLGTLRFGLGTGRLQRDLARARVRRAATMSNVILLYAGFTVGFVLLGVGAALVLARRITRPLERLSRDAQTIASGNLDVAVPDLGADEVGVLGRNLDRMRVAIKHLLEGAAEKARMDGELRTAQAVQRALIPASPPAIAGLEIAAAYHPASEVGGDWYGFLPGDVGERLYVLIGDVTGHGAPSALLTASACAACEVLGGQQAEGRPLQPQSLLGELNRIILEVGKGDYLMTFLAARFDVARREVTFASAGHNPPLHRRGALERRERIRHLSNGPTPVLGAGPGLVTTDRTMMFAAGDSFVFYTDGLVECEGPAGTPWGNQALGRVVAEHEGDATSLRDKILAEAFAHYGDVARKDDVTLIVVRTT
jgi:serine phosphatase RsbU (regulator of sigma subunit)